MHLWPFGCIAEPAKQRADSTKTSAYLLHLEARVCIVHVLYGAPRDLVQLRPLRVPRAGFWRGARHAGALHCIHRPCICVCKAKLARCLKSRPAAQLCSWPSIELLEQCAAAPRASVSEADARPPRVTAAAVLLELQDSVWQHCVQIASPKKKTSLRLGRVKAASCSKPGGAHKGHSGQRMLRGEVLLEDLAQQVVLTRGRRVLREARGSLGPHLVAHMLHGAEFSLCGLSCYEVFPAYCQHPFAEMLEHAEAAEREDC